MIWWKKGTDTDINNGMSPTKPQRAFTNSFAPTKQKILLSILLSGIAFFLFIGAIIVGADSEDMGVIHFAFLLFPPAVLESTLGTFGIKYYSPLGFLLEFFYFYFLVCFLVYIGYQYRTHKKIGHSIMVITILSLTALILYESTQPVQCTYTEKPVMIPASLADKKLVLEKDEFLVVGPGVKHGGGCVPSLGTIENEIETHESIDNPTIGTRYFTNKGLTVNPLAKGKVFVIEKIIDISRKNHSPGRHLILRDENSTYYDIADIDLGNDYGYYEKGAIFSFQNDNRQKEFFTEEQLNSIEPAIKR